EPAAGGPGPVAPAPPPPSARPARPTRLRARSRVARPALPSAPRSPPPRPGRVEMPAEVQLLVVRRRWSHSALDSRQPRRCSAIAQFNSARVALLPGVPSPVTPNAPRQFQTALVPTPNQCLRADADSDRIARLNS